MLFILQIDSLDQLKSLLLYTIITARVILTVMIFLVKVFRLLGYSSFFSSEGFIIASILFMKLSISLSAPKILPITVFVVSIIK